MRCFVRVQIKSHKTFQQWPNLPDLLHQDRTLTRGDTLWLQIPGIVAINKFHDGVEALFFRLALASYVWPNSASSTVSAGKAHGSAFAGVLARPQS